MNAFFKKISGLFRKKKLDADMAEEMRAHLERRTQANLDSGMSVDEARYAARRQFGGVEQLKEIAREQRAGQGFDNVIRDVRFALRQLSKSPGFTATTILILGLGIGGVTAMFSTLYAVMIRPLPFPNAERLVLGRATFSGEINPMVAGLDYFDYREQSRSFSALGAFMSQTSEVSVSNGPNTERAAGLNVTTGLFQALGARMSMGRMFAAGDDKAESPPMAIVSHAYWRRHYGEGNDLAGQTITIDGVTRAVVGVTAPDFHFVDQADIWLLSTPRDLGPRRYNNWLVVGRLKDGVPLAAAQSEVDVIAAQLEKAYPDTNAKKALLLSPLQSAFTEQYRMGFVMLCGGAAAVLLIACANAAGLLLARGAGRQGELAVRAAMGASHWQIMRLLLAEALLLAAGGGVLGTVFALAMQSGLMRLFSINTLFLRDVGLSWPVLGFVVCITVVTGVGFGVLPAWRAKSPDLAEAMKSIGRGNSRHGSRLRGGLVAAQVAISFILLVVAGLLTRSLSSLHRTDPGFNPRNLLTVEVPLPPREYNGPQRTQYFELFLENIRSLPGVQSAAAISQLPLRNPGNDIALYDASAPPVAPSGGGNGYQRVVLPGYFEAMRIPLLAGRDVRASDTRNSARVVVISQVLAEQLFPARDPLGRKVIIDGATQTPWEVVGVVGDTKMGDLREGPRSRGAFYRPHSQSSSATMRLAIRTTIEPHMVVTPLHALLQKMDSRVPLSGPRTMEEVMDNATLSEKAQTLSLMTFSLLALILAAVGIHGVLAYSVAQRRRDIGIRMALGASHRDVAWSILRQASLLALIGAAAGLLGSLAISHLIRGSLYGIGPQDPTVFVTSGLVLVLIAALAAWFPARRATLVNPVEALRAE